MISLQNACLLAGPLIAFLCNSCAAASGDEVTISDSGETSNSPANFPGDGALDTNSEPVFDFPEEVAVVESFQSPVVSGDFLWSTNPQSGRVVLIDASTLATRVLDGGLTPTHLAAIPVSEYDAAAIVLNVGSTDATLFRVSGPGVASQRISLHEGADRWTVSHTGEWAVAWSRGAAALDPTNGLQEITIIDLRGETAVPRRVTVGYRPSLLSFNADETELSVVSKRGISILELENHNLRWVELSQGEQRQVLLVEDGKHALVRMKDAKEIQIVDLQGEEEPLVLGFPGAITDWELSAEGRAVVVVRDLSYVSTFLVNEVFQSSEEIHDVVVGGELVGSVELSESGGAAVLFTNALSSTRVSLLNLEPGENFLSYRVLDTQTLVQSVKMSPDGQYAVALGRPTEGASAGVFSLLSLGDERFSRVIGTRAPLGDLHLGNRFGLQTASAVGGVHEAHLIDLLELKVETVELASPVLSSGLFPSLDVGFAAQVHPEGRVSLFDFTQVSTQTLTGFELSAEIVEE